MRVRSNLRLVCAAMALAMLLTACADSGEVDDAPTEGATEGTDGAETPASEDDEQAAAGGTLVAAITQDPGHLNPAITTSGGTHTASELLYNGLVRLNADLEIEPDLAESWEITNDGATYTFQLRDDVVWHDGEPFTSEDVKYTFEEVLLKFHSRTSASLGGALSSIETPDDHTVVFNFDFPYAPLLQQLNVTEAPILPEHVYAGTDPQTADANLDPVGTGPFQFVSYEPDSEVRLERNPDYFRDGLPYLDEVVMRIIPEESNQVLAFEQGEVDWLWGVPGPDLERFRDNPDVELLETSVNPGGGNCIMTVSFNLDRPILQDRRVREAFALGVDREPMLENILFGAGRIAEAPISSGIPFAHAEGLDMPGHDPERARQLLEEAGWVAQEGDGPRIAQGVEGVEDGTELRLDFLAFPNFARYGELARPQLAEIGIDLVVEPTERASLIERVFTQRDFDTNLISYCNQSDPEIGVRRMYISSNIQPIPFSNSSGYVNEQVDALFDEARETVDPDARSEVYREIQEILVDELPYYWFVETLSTRAYTADCEGFLPFGHWAEAASCE